MLYDLDTFCKQEFPVNHTKRSIKKVDNNQLSNHSNYTNEDIETDIDCEGNEEKQQTDEFIEILKLRHLSLSK